MEIGWIIGLVISALIVGTFMGVFLMCLMFVASGADDRLSQMEKAPYWEIKYAPFREQGTDDRKEQIVASLNELYGSPDGLKRALENEYGADRRAE